jgi:hypothetical protein
MRVNYNYSSYNYSSYNYSSYNYSNYNNSSYNGTQNESDISNAWPVMGKFEINLKTIFITQNTAIMGNNGNGNGRPWTVESVDGTVAMIVDFSTDQSVTGKGFTATYTLTPDIFAFG